MALLGTPDLLVLDEPTVGLDPVLRRDLWDLFHRIADGGAAVLVSSHVMDEAERCHRLLLMREGRIIADGSPDEIRRSTGAPDIEQAFLHLVEGRGERGMNARVTLAVAGRVLTQVRRDHRTLAMLLVVPCVLITLLWWMFADLPGDLFDRFGPGLLAMFPFIVMFLVTSVTTLRERSSGTLERLLTMPLGKLDFLLGYAIAFGLLAAVQSTLAVAVSVGLLGLDVAGPVWLLGVVAVADAVLGTALGLLVSAFATTEFQAVQFMPAFVLPADPALRALRAARGDAHRARGDQQRAADVVRHRRHAGARRGRRHERGVARRGWSWPVSRWVRSRSAPPPSGAGHPDPDPVSCCTSASGSDPAEQHAPNRPAYITVSMMTSAIDAAVSSAATRTTATTPATSVVAAAAPRASTMPPGRNRVATATTSRTAGAAR